jgi:hypothetical protein
MKRTFTAIFLFCLCAVSLFCQNSKEELAKKLQQEVNSQNAFFIGGGATLSSVNVFKNFKSKPYGIGYDVRMFYEMNYTIRLMAQYTLVPKFDFAPTWLNVRSHSFDAGFNLMARILDQEANFYTITTLSYHTFKGFYTGLNDFSNQKNKYQLNTDQKENYLGICLGAGFERSFVNTDVFLDFRYRFAVDGSVFSISDAAYSLGLKRRIDFIKLKKKNKFFDKYHWF